MAGLPPDEVWRLFGASDDPGLRAITPVMLQRMVPGWANAVEMVREVVKERDEARREHDRLRRLVALAKSYRNCCRNDHAEDLEGIQAEQDAEFDALNAMCDALDEDDALGVPRG